MESFGAMKDVDPKSASEARALSLLENTTSHDGQRYSVGMLWAEDNSELPNNFYSASAQLKSLEKRLDKDPELKQRYSKSIAEDIEKGYVIIVPQEQLNGNSPRDWYLPHHPVLNPNKPGKLRRVLNGAATFHHKSLNSSLLAGPDLLRNLFSVLIRFREHPYAASADIEGMFLQVGVPPADQRSLRFLWQEDPLSKVVVHQYIRHIFGAKDSPTCANYGLQQT